MSRHRAVVSRVHYFLYLCFTPFSNALLSASLYKDSLSHCKISYLCTFAPLRVLRFLLHCLPAGIWLPVDNTIPETLNCPYSIPLSKDLKNDLSSPLSSISSDMNVSHLGSVTFTNLSGERETLLGLPEAQIIEIFGTDRQYPFA